MYCLTITIDEDKREIASAVGYAHGMGGCVEEQFGNDVILTFYFTGEACAVSAAASFAETLAVDTPAVTFMEDKQDWNAKWRESMEPAEIACGVWVSPTWLEPPAAGRKAWIKIEPKMAFGTGHHETTRLAAKGIMFHADFVLGKSVLDIGTGSGVLCFVADHVGAKHTIGVEIDGDCRENLAENLRDNPPHPAGRVDFIIGTLDALRVDGDKKFDTVIMNMLITESEPLLERVSEIMRDKSILIWSGILTSERDEAIDAAGRAGFKLTGENAENEWWCGAFNPALT